MAILSPMGMRSLMTLEELMGMGFPFGTIKLSLFQNLQAILKAGTQHRSSFAMTMH
jgi:hypothetical protein